MRWPSFWFVDDALPVDDHLTVTTKLPMNAYKIPRTDTHGTNERTPSNSLRTSNEWGHTTGSTKPRWSDRWTLGASRALRSPSRGRSSLWSIHERIFVIPPIAIRWYLLGAQRWTLKKVFILLLCSSWNFYWRLS